LKGGKMGYPGELLEIVCKNHVLGLRVGS
jgi:hypothetical protein